MISAGTLAEIRGDSRRTATRLLRDLERKQSLDGRPRVYRVGRRRETTIDVLLAERLISATQLGFWRECRLELRDLREAVEAHERTIRIHSREISEFRRVSREWYARKVGR